MENTVRHHVNAFSAFADLIDNPTEAGAHHCKIEQLRDGLVMSDDGTGFSGIRHLVDSYDVGKSIGEGKDLGFNYGQGEKAGGLMLADTILKLAAFPDGSRGIVMLSRTMQKAEANSQSEHQWQLQSIWRPWAHFKRSQQDIEAWALSSQSSAADLELILKYSPFKAEASLMTAFDELQDGGFRTHMILHELKSAVQIQHSCIDADVLLADYTEGCWTAKKSVYSLIAAAFPLVDDASSNTEFTLLERKVKPLDLRPNAAIWQSDTIEMAPGDKLTGTADHQLHNNTDFWLRVGFVFDKRELMSRGKQLGSLFRESSDNPLQGLMALSSRGRTMQLPIPVELGRGGSLVTGK